MDDLDVLDAAHELLAAVRAPLDDVKAAAEGRDCSSAQEFLGKAAAKSTKTLEDRHKRELTAKEREGISEVLNVAESWLRDCLALSQGVGDLGLQCRRHRCHGRGGGRDHSGRRRERAGGRQRGQKAHFV